MNGAKAFSLSFERTTANGTGDDEEDGTCSAAFFLDKDEAVFNFSGDEVRPLKKALLPQGERRMILDWAIGGTTCDQAQSYTFDQLCPDGTCVDAPSGAGYLCKCPDGYNGNPYVSDGCQGKLRFLLHPSKTVARSFLCFSKVGKTEKSFSGNKKIIFH